MTWWKVTVTSQQAITMGTGATRAFHTPSLGYIPGSVLRGALARAWLVAHGEGHPEFQRIFDGPLRFGPLLAEGSDIANQSVARRKYWAGDAPYVDRAFHDGEDLGVAEQLKGEVMWASGDGMTSTVRTALDQVTRTAKEGSLFSRESHCRDRVFVGHIVGDPELVEPLRKIQHLSIGGQRSVQGRATVTIEQTDTPTVHAAPRVVLRTLSPSILVDDAGRPVLDFAAAFPGCDVENAWGTRLASDGTGGWHAASNTPKPSDAAIAPGAVVVLRDADPKVVDDLLNRGIGTRRVEGFGWLEEVAEPWSPPTSEEERKIRREPGEAAWRKALEWTPRARKSVAKWLRELNGAADLTRIEKQRAWLSLTEGQRDAVGRILRETPEAHRKVIAGALERN